MDGGVSGRRRWTWPVGPLVAGALVVGGMDAEARRGAKDAPCIARGGVACVTFAFDPVPDGLPAVLEAQVRRWMRSDVAGEGKVYADVEALHRQVEGEWRQVYREGGQGEGTPWTVERRVHRTRVPAASPWTSVLLVERYALGGAHGNYRVSSAAARDADGAPVEWGDLFARGEDDAGLEALIHRRIERRYPGYRREAAPDDALWGQALPADAWHADAEGVELWWWPYHIGPYAMEYHGPPRVRIEWAALEQWIDPALFPGTGEWVEP